MVRPALSYGSQVRGEILARVAAGERLTAVCAGAGMPCCESVTGWARKDPDGFGAALKDAYARGSSRRRGAVDVAAARAILEGLGAGRRLEDLVRGSGAPSLRTFMAWTRDEA